MELLNIASFVLLYGSHMNFSINNYKTSIARPTILAASFVLIENGAGNGNRTRLSCLEGRRTGRCTTPASKMWGTPRNAPREDRNLKKGEKIFFFPCIYIIQKFFWKINSFANVPMTIFLICLITIGIWYVKPFPFMPSFDETLPVLLKRSADCLKVANRIIM